MKSTRVKRRVLPGSPFETPEDVALQTWEAQDRVSHDRYGLGHIAVVENERSVVVDFGGQQVRVVAPFSKLTKL